MVTSLFLASLSVSRAHAESAHKNYRSTLHEASPLNNPLGRCIPGSKVCGAAPTLPTTTTTVLPTVKTRPPSSISTTLPKPSPPTTLPKKLLNLNRSDADTIKRLSIGGLYVLALRTWAPAIDQQHQHLLTGHLNNLSDKVCRNTVEKLLIEQRRQLAISKEMSKNFSVYLEVLGILFSGKDIARAFLNVKTERAALSLVSGNMVQKTQQIAPWLTTSLSDAGKWAVELGTGLGLYTSWKSNAKISLFALTNCGPPS